MTTLEITISDDSKLEHFITMLKEIRFVSDVQLGTKKETKGKKAKINWTDEKLDPETERLVWECIAKHEAGVPSNSPTIKEVFYDL